MDRLLEATARAERDHFWFHGFRRFITPLLQQAAEGHATPDILDCGCGTGNNLQLLRKYGHAVGIDLTFSGLKYATSRGDRLVAQASVTDLPFPDAAFDIVTSFDVVYALPDAAEKAAVSEMFRVLRAGGHLVLNVAALESLRGNHSVLGGEVRRVLPQPAQLGARTGRIRDPPPDLHERQHPAAGRRDPVAAAHPRAPGVLGRNHRTLGTHQHRLDRCPGRRVGRPPLHGYAFGIVGAVPRRANLPESRYLTAIEYTRNAR